MSENGHYGHDENGYHIDPVEWGEQRQLVKEIHQMVKIQNGRVGKLERWQSWIKGALALLGLSLPVIGYFIIKVYERVAP